MDTSVELSVKVVQIQAYSIAYCHYIAILVRNSKINILEFKLHRWFGKNTYTYISISREQMYKTYGEKWIKTGILTWKEFINTKI